MAPSAIYYHTIRTVTKSGEINYRSFVVNIPNPLRRKLGLISSPFTLWNYVFGLELGLNSSTTVVGNPYNREAFASRRGYVKTDSRFELCSLF